MAGFCPWSLAFVEECGTGINKDDILLILHPAAFVISYQKIDLHVNCTGRGPGYSRFSGKRQIP
jgi:hypothetical protein